MMQLTLSTQDLVHSLVAKVNHQRPPLPDLPIPSQSPPKRRSAAEDEALLVAQSARIEIADKADLAREALARWRDQVLALLDELEDVLRETQPIDQTDLDDDDEQTTVKRTRSSRRSKGKLSALPQLPSDGIGDPTQKVVLHRALLNSHDLFSTLGDLTMQDMLDDPTLLSQLKQRRLASYTIGKNHIT